MAVHLEFVVAGPPISNQQRHGRGKAVLNAWKASVLAHVQATWSSPKLTGILQATIINFHTGPEPSVGVDNMSKPIFDEMQRDVYDDDRQIRQAHLTHSGDWCAGHLDRRIGSPRDGIAKRPRER